MTDLIDSKDVVSRWLQAAEKSGESMDILFGRGCSRTQSIDWRSYSHLQYDGLGAFARMLSDENGIPISMPLGKFPQAPETAQPPASIVPHSSARYTASSNLAMVRDCIENGRLAWHHFSLEASQALQSRARELQCTVNSLLLHTLNKSLLPGNTMGSDFSWLIPVNLRGGLSLRRSSSNQVSYIHHTERTAYCVQSTHRQLQLQLQRGNHWRQYRRMRYLCRLPLSLRQWILKRQRLKLVLPTGTFSNLGQWDAEEALKKEYFWLFCPPLASHHLVAAGSLCFQNQISLALRISANSPLAQRPAKEYMQAWQNNLIQTHI